VKPGVIDTNILLYVANKDPTENSRAKSFLENAIGARETWYLTDGIIYEFFRVSTHPKVFPRPLGWKEAMEFLTPIVTSANFQRLQPAEGHLNSLCAILDELTHPSGNLFFDIRTATLMRDNGVRMIYTADTDFLQFRDLDVINPLKVVGS
jgi:uncharacterized protein